MPLPGTPYKNSPAGLITHDVRKRISLLVSKGKLYGKWQEQEQIARTLAKQAKNRKFQKIR
jgi:hypothetical protein